MEVGSRVFGDLVRNPQAEWRHPVCEACEASKFLRDSGSKQQVMLLADIDITDMVHLRPAHVVLMSQEVDLGRCR